MEKVIRITPIGGIYLLTVLHRTERHNSLESAQASLSVHLRRLRRIKEPEIYVRGRVMGIKGAYFKHQTFIALSAKDTGEWHIGVETYSTADAKKFLITRAKALLKQIEK